MQLKQGIPILSWGEHEIKIKWYKLIWNLDQETPACPGNNLYSTAWPGCKMYLGGKVLQGETNIYPSWS